VALLPENRSHAPSIPGWEVFTDPDGKYLSPRPGVNGSTVTGKGLPPRNEVTRAKGLLR